MNEPRVTSAFVKSTYSGRAVNDCVAVARTASGGRAVRDSKRPGGGTSYHSPTA